MTVYDLVGGIQLGGPIPVSGEWTIRGVRDGLLRSAPRRWSRTRRQRAGRHRGVGPAAVIACGSRLCDGGPRPHPRRMAGLPRRPRPRTGRRAGSGRPLPRPRTRGREGAAATLDLNGCATPNATTNRRRSARRRHAAAATAACTVAASVTSNPDSPPPGPLGPPRATLPAPRGAPRRRRRRRAPRCPHAHAAAGHDLDRPAGLRTMRGEHVAAGSAVGGAARGEHAAHAGSRQRNHGGQRVGSGIHGPVHRDVEPLGGVDERGDRREVELTGIRQRTDDDTVGAERPRLRGCRGRSIAARRRRRRSRRRGGAPARARRRARMPRRPLHRGRDESGRRREPAEAERLAELDPRGTRLERDAHAGGILDGDLDGEESWHPVTLLERAPTTMTPVDRRCREGGFAPTRSSQRPFDRSVRSTRCDRLRSPARSHQQLAHIAVGGRLHQRAMHGGRRPTAPDAPGHGARRRRKRSRSVAHPHEGDRECDDGRRGDEAKAVWLACSWFHAAPTGYASVPRRVCSRYARYARVIDGGPRNGEQCGA